MKGNEWPEIEAAEMLELYGLWKEARIEGCSISQGENLKRRALDILNEVFEDYEARGETYDR